MKRSIIRTASLILICSMLSVFLFSCSSSNNMEIQSGSSGSGANDGYSAESDDHSAPAKTYRYTDVFDAFNSRLRDANLPECKIGDGEGGHYNGEYYISWSGELADKMNLGMIYVIREQEDVLSSVKVTTPLFNVQTGADCDTEEEVEQATIETLKMATAFCVPSADFSSFSEKLFETAVEGKYETTAEYSDGNWTYMLSVSSASVQVTVECED